MKLYELRDIYQDPRPDIKHDHNLWMRILLGAKKYPDLHARLHFVRCMGGYIKETETMYQLMQGEMTDQEWETTKEKVLEPIKEILVDYFKMCRCFTEVTDEELIEEAARLFDVKPEQLVFGDKDSIRKAKIS